jgi:hypothetical protein
MKLTKIMIAILTITSFMLLATASNQPPIKHARPSMANIISGWAQQLRRAGGAKFTRGLRDAGDNAGIAVVHRISKTGNAIATGVGKTYATACVVADSSVNLIGNVVTGTWTVGKVVAGAGVKAYDAGMDSLAGSSVTCVEPAWVEMKRTIKHVLVHSNNIHTVSVKVLDDNFPGLSTNVTKILRRKPKYALDICAAWKHIPEAVNKVLLESDGSHPHYGTNAELAAAFDDAFLTDPSVREHIQEDCNTFFDTSC